MRSPVRDGVSSLQHHGVLQVWQTSHTTLPGVCRQFLPSPYFLSLLKVLSCTHKSAF